MGKLMLLILVMYILVFGLISLNLFIEFKLSNYRHASKQTFLQIFFNKGSWGEYKIYTILEGIKGEKQLLTNLYLPKKDGSTTEIDLVMITKAGFFVIESKNYGGWIFGNEASRYWTQSFPNKKKGKFLNPIWQNKGHIKALQEILCITDESLIHSIIVFSNKCELKKITVKSSNVKVIKRNRLKHTLKKRFVDTNPKLSSEEIKRYAQALKHFVHADEETKLLHNERIKEKLSR
ncbi:MAG: nuclease-related domain-containing protein [Carnobacterium sp.]|uniref:nuclease-related domain-containing protein n=1 Tax=Carnobacterium sp. TaxID=48221 RepID=UPI003C714767